MVDGTVLAETKCEGRNTSTDYAKEAFSDAGVWVSV